MTENTDELIKKLTEQDKQIVALKRAIVMLERKLQAVSVVANRANHQSKRVTEDVRAVQHKLRKG